LNVEISAILLGLVVLIAAGYYVIRPLMQPKRAAKADDAALMLEARRDSLYTQIKELDLDYATGKINDEDYTRLRADLVAQAAAVLKQIDTGVPAEQSSTVSGDDEVEALIAARRKTRSTSTPKTAASAADVSIEAAIAARRKTTVPVVEPAAFTCPRCGKPAAADDAFCAKCGAALQSQTVP
jgi:hypothetical protein